MPKTSLPSLDSNDSASRLDDIQFQRVAQPESDTIVNLLR